MFLSTTRVACVALLLLMAADAAAQPGSDAPRAREVLRSMTDFLHSAKHLSFHGELNYDQLSTWGQKIQLAGAGDMAISRPNKLHADFRDDLASRKFWYDGKTVTLLDPSSGFYGSEKAAPELDDMVDQVERELGLRLPLAQLLTAGPYKEIEKRIARVHYMGIHDVDGVACHHLALQGEDRDIQVWVEVGDQPLLRKFVVDYKDAPGTPRYMMVLMDWSFDAPPASTFEAKLPDDAVRVDFLGMDRKEGTR